MTNLSLGDDDDAVLEELLGVSSQKEEPKPPAETMPAFEDDDVDLGDFFAESGIEQSENEPDLTKPWMKALGLDRFHLVTSEDDYDKVIDRIIEVGEGALDLECEGFDNRIDYDEEGRPRTKHAIVGVCLGVEGHGYYIPLRHKFQATYGEKDPNLDVGRVEAGLKKLCQAAQPKITEEGLAEDPLGSPKIDKSHRHIKLFFWNAKFDQEFLFPVVDIDFWHPNSFEDGLLAAYVIYSDDALGLKEHSSRRLHVKQGDEFLPCEMIEFPELFPKGTPRKTLKIADLYPEVGTDGTPNKVVLYGCSDGICTWMLCTAKENLPSNVVRVTRPAELKMPEKDREPENFVELARRGKRYMFTYRLELQTAQCVRTVERSRVKVDVAEIERVKNEAEEESKSYLEKIQAVAETRGFKGLNPGSTEQLSEFLFGSKGLDINPKPDKTDSGDQYKTDSDTLEKLHEKLGDGAPEILLWVIKYRQIEKQVGTYLTGMLNSVDENGCLRLNFRQEGAATGRFTAPKGKEGHGYAQVPIQGIPSKNDPKRPACANSLRRVFVPRDEYVLSKVDYAGQELRVVANISGEDLWINEFLEGDGDLHTLTAQAFFPGLTRESPDFKEKRKSGKIANFALIYGGGVQAVMRATKCDQSEAARKLTSFHKSVPKFATWVKNQHACVKKHKGVVTGFLRWMSIPDANTKPGDEYVLKGEVKKRDFKDAKKIVAACERKSTNWPIQGCLDLRSLVNTRNGWESVGSLEAKGEPFTVWTGSRWAEAIARDMGPCELAEIKLKDGTTVRCDTRHKLLIVDDEGYRWVEYSDLEPGMAVATALCEPVEYKPTSLPSVRERKQSKVHFDIQDIEGFWYWMGRYIGDGWLDPRGGIQFFFGGHEREAIERCKEFWRVAGFNPTESESTHTPKYKESTRFAVNVWSVNLYDWVLSLGFQVGVTAHTKRCPSRIFSESLANRRAFLRGVLDSDGHRPSPPKKVDGKWERKGTGKGNPYGVHLCQRPLLEDLKLLFRSAGVESTIRGPYRSGEDKNGEDTTSYRLDIQRRMYERNVMGRTDVRHPTFQDMFAPQFLVDEFLRAGPWKPSAFPDESSYVLYLRLKVGGRVTVYTLQRLCQILNVELSAPIYGFKRLVEKQALGREEHTYTLSVQDPLHRFEADGVITKNSGADILKISLVRLQKEFTRRGWLKTGGDDSVRMVMTVHDEIVFEIRKDRLQEAMPVIIQCMESPSNLPRPKWRIPLIVEPLVGMNWEQGKSDGSDDWLKIIEGSVPMPEYLQGYVTPGKEPPLALPEPPKPSPEPKAATPTPAPPPTQKPSVAPPKGHQVAVFKLAFAAMTWESLGMIRGAVAQSDPYQVSRGKEMEGPLLHLVNCQDQTLIGTELALMIDPETFKVEMKRQGFPCEYELTVVD